MDTNERLTFLTDNWPALAVEGVCTTPQLVAQGIYSHSSAARLHGFSTWGCGSSIHLSFPAGSNRKSNGPGVSSHVQQLETGRLRFHYLGGASVTVTSPTQTVVDCLRLFSPQVSTVIADSALQLGLSLGDLESCLDTSPVVRGSAKARRLLPLLDSRSESAGESRTRLLLHCMNLPTAELQVEIFSRLGTHRVDFAWPQFKIALEFDGWGKYFDYAPAALLQFLASFSMIGL